MSRAQMDVRFGHGATVRVSGTSSDFTVELLDGRYDQTGAVTTTDPAALRQLAKALTQVADFMEADGG